MIKVIMHGCCGKMGKVVCQLVNDDPDCELVAGIDPFCENADFPVFKSVFDCDVDADVIIDFSTASAVPALLEYAEKKQIPVVLCTTGFSDELNEQVISTSKNVAVLKSANMSVGVNLLFSLVQKAALALADSGQAEPLLQLPMR